MSIRFVLTARDTSETVTIDAPVVREYVKDGQRRVAAPAERETSSVLDAIRQTKLGAPGAILA